VVVISAPYFQLPPTPSSVSCVEPLFLHSRQEYFRLLSSHAVEKKARIRLGKGPVVAPFELFEKTICWY
jgi:hypothetical protein